MVTIASNSVPKHLCDFITSVITVSSIQFQCSIPHILDNQRYITISAVYRHHENTKWWADSQTIGQIEHASFLHSISIVYYSGLNFYRQAVPLSLGTHMGRWILATVPLRRKLMHASKALVSVSWLASSKLDKILKHLKMFMQISTRKTFSSSI